MASASPTIPQTEIGESRIPVEERKTQSAAAASRIAPVTPRNPLVRVVFLLLAGVTFLLGVAGVFLPGLPTTPFLLLTSYCLAKSSPRCQAWLLRSRLFGTLIRDWQNHRGIRRHTKYRAVALIAIVVGLSCWLGNLSTTIVCIVVAAALTGTAIVLALPAVHSVDEASR